MNKIIINCDTGEETTIPLSQEEIELINAQNAESEAKEAELEATRVSAKSKLAALGLTEEEIAAIVGA